MDGNAFPGQGYEEVNQAQFVGVNWLEYYHYRLISGDLHPICQCYVPYDQRDQKGEWGKEVMEQRYEVVTGTSEESSYEDKPWMLWDRCSHRIEAEESMGCQMLSFVGGALEGDYPIHRRKKRKNQK
jgi:hypothetical protein